MAVGELLIVCDMGDKVEMSSGQNFPRAGTRLRHLAPAGQIRGHWEHDDPHDITRTGAVDSVDTRSSLGEEKRMMMDKTVTIMMKTSRVRLRDCAPAHQSLLEYPSATIVIEIPRILVSPS